MTAQPEYIPADLGSPEAVAGDLATLDVTVNRLDADSLAYLNDHMSPQSAVDLLAKVRALRVRLATVEASVEALTVARLYRRSQRVGGFIAEVRGGVKRAQWLHDQLAWAICRDLTVDSNGEVDDAAAELVEKVRDRFLDAAQVAYWRAGQLRLLGIDPADYSTSEPGRRTVQLTPAVDEPASDG